MTMTFTQSLLTFAASGCRSGQPARAMVKDS